MELLGFDPQKKLREESGGYDYYERQVSFVAPEKREQLRRYLEEFQEKEQDHYGRNRGLYDAQERAERREMQEEKKRGLAAFLTPEELRQWELRSSQMASQLQSEITTMSLTQAQYEALFAVRSTWRFGELLFSGAVNNTSISVQVERHGVGYRLTHARGINHHTAAVPDVFE